MDTPPRDEAQEALLRDIIAQGSDAVYSLMFLNDNDGLEGEGEEVDREDGSGDHQTESGQVYILVKPVLTS